MLLAGVDHPVGVADLRGDGLFADHRTDARFGARDGDFGVPRRVRGDADYIEVFAVVEVEDKHDAYSYPPFPVGATQAEKDAILADMTAEVIADMLDKYGTGA